MLPATIRQEVKIRLKTTQELDVAPRRGLPGAAVHTLSESSKLQGFGIKLPARSEATTTERIL